METKQLLTYGLMGGAAYFVYKAFAGSTVAPGSTVARAAQQGAGQQLQTQPTSVTTPTVTQPANTPLTSSSLTAAASVQGYSGDLSPDQWNWFVVNVLRAQPFNVDAIFGSTATAARMAKYSAQDFLDIATGAKTLPAAASAPLATTQTCPPDCGSDPVSAIVHILQTAAPGVTGYRPDQWNYYLGAYYDMNKFFGPVGQLWRDTTYTAQDFAQVVTGQIQSGYVAPGVSGLGQIVVNMPGLYTSADVPHAILRPNIPGPRRWVAPSQRPHVREFVDRKGGWAV
jgi:hypothetical protein